MNSTRRLAIRDLFINRGLNFFDLLLKPLGELTHLDLSSAFHNQGMQGYVTMTMVIVIIIVMIKIMMTIFIITLIMMRMIMMRKRMMRKMSRFSWLLHTPRLLSLTLHNVKV